MSLKTRDTTGWMAQPYRLLVTRLSQRRRAATGRERSLACVRLRVARTAYRAIRRMLKCWAEIVNDLNTTR